jgi:hypothetical protein
MDKNLAPIVVFAFNRPWHTQQTIEALQKNELANKSELFIFSDGGKDEKSWQKVNLVRDYLRTIKGFKNITLTFQDKNIGLADSIISGVTNVINKYGKIIVLEDDHLTNKYFLKFMNEALTFYEKEEKIWQVSGWFFPLEKDGLNNVIFHKAMNCTGWGTWKSRWQHFEKNSNKLIDTYTSEDIKNFNLNNAYDKWLQVLLNHKKTINTWAVFWYEVMFKHGGLTVCPSKTMIRNIGFDGSGTHSCELSGIDDDNYYDSYSIKLETNVAEDKIAMDRIKLFYIGIQNKNKIFSRSLNKLFGFLTDIQRTNKNFILYGTGTGFDLVLSQIPKNRILYAIDQDVKKHNTYKKDIKIIELSHFKNAYTQKADIIITVFGRSNEITNLLIDKYQVDKDRIISLDILEDFYS